MRVIARNRSPVLVLTAALDLAFLAVAFGVRTVVQRRRTGDSGWRLGKPHSAAEAASRALLFGAGIALAVALVTAGGLSSLPLAVAGATAGLAAIAFVSVAQLQMGASWRIGVDPDEVTSLVQDGVYAHVRNPIYTGMAAYALAHVAMTPSVWSALGAAAMAAGVELQVRAVEEPYLERVHGDRYRTWAARSGRFVPGLG